MIRETRRVERAWRPSQVFRRVAGEPSSRRRAADLVLIAGFLIAIWLPLAGMILGLDAAFVLPENRTLAPRPALARERDALRQFPVKFESYFNDRFGFRKRLIHWLSIVEVEGLGVSTSPHVVLGRGGWLFYTDDAALKDYRRTELMTPDELNDWRRVVESRRDWLAARGIRYLFVVMPNKETIYPEFMRGAYNRVRRRSRLDQFLTYMKAHSDVPILDVRDELRRAKAGGRLYDVTDSHWNTRGADVAYRRMIEALSAWFPGMRPLPRSALREVAQTTEGGDLALMLGLQDRIREESLSLEPSVPWRARPGDAGRLTLSPGVRAAIAPMERADPEWPRAVVFHDSFMERLVPELSEHFRRVVYAATYDFDRTLVESERPDIVIQEVVERALLGLLPHNL